MSLPTSHIMIQNAAEKESAPGSPRVTPNASFDTQPEDTPATRIPSQGDTTTALTNPHTTLQGLLKVHDELRIWLDHTGFFDLEHRRRVLDGVRELQGLEAERAKVLQKIQSSKPVEMTVPESSASSGRAPTLKRPPFVRDASYGQLSPPREPSSHTRSRSSVMMPLTREMAQLAVRPPPRQGECDISRLDGLIVTEYSRHSFLLGQVLQHDQRIHVAKRRKLYISLSAIRILTAPGPMDNTSQKRPPLHASLSRMQIRRALLLD